MKTIYLALITGCASLIMMVIHILSIGGWVSMVSWVLMITFWFATIAFAFLSQKNAKSAKGETKEK